MRFLRSICEAMVFGGGARVMHSVVQNTALLASLAAVLLCGAPNVSAVVVTDDFSDMNDTANPTWTHLDKLVGSTGQTWDASSGQYHLVAPSNGVIDLAPQFNDLGFVGSYVQPTFADVKAAADFVNFQTEAFGPVFFYGVGARFDGANTVPTLGQGFTTRGYGYAYEPENQEMVLYLFTGSGNRDIGSQRVTLDPEKDYRFELEVIGSTLHGRALELVSGGESILVAERFRDLVAEPVNVDHDGDPATEQIVHVPYTSGFSSVFGVGNVFDSDLDFTIDNFRTETAVAGDYNRNGETDAADYVLWRKTLGSTGPDGNPAADFGDMRANGALTNGYTQTIEQADYDFWQANFGRSVAAGSGSGAAVPEPAGAMLILLGATSLWFLRERSR
jgi:hypothetical protein